MNEDRTERAKLHDQRIVWLAEEEAAFNTCARAAAQAIRMKKEYRKMNESEIIPAPQATLVSVITTAAKDPRTDTAKLQQLLEMAERMMRFEAERAFNDAMRQCQDEIAPIARTAQNTHTGTT